jgi:hypothetical protein
MFTIPWKVKTFHVAPFLKGSTSKRLEAKLLTHGPLGKYLPNYSKDITQLFCFLMLKCNDFFPSFLHLLTCVYIVWATSPAPSPPTASGKNLFCPLVLWFFEEKTCDNKKDLAFLLLWGKDSYTERLLALLPCTCVLQPTLVHVCQTSSLLLVPFP